MNSEDNNHQEQEAEQPLPRWFIDRDWFLRNNRSFTVVATSGLCPGCRKRLAEKSAEITDDDLLTTIRDCCSKEPDFITSELPVLASVFRLLLSSGKHPLNSEELSRQLNEWRRGYPVSPATLNELLKHDRYYGLSQSPG